MAGGLNTYAYVNNNPINFYDTIGLYSNTDEAAIATCKEIWKKKKQDIEYCASIKTEEPCEVSDIIKGSEHTCPLSKVWKPGDSSLHSHPGYPAGPDHFQNKPSLGIDRNGGLVRDLSKPYYLDMPNGYLCTPNGNVIKYDKQSVNFRPSKNPTWMSIQYQIYNPGTDAWTDYSSTPKPIRKR